MNGMPPHDNGPEDIEEYYRRTSALSPSAPGESVRGRILAHAARVAAERESQQGARQGVLRGRASGRGWKPAFVGSLLAACLAGLLITPNLHLSLSSQKATAVETATPSDAAEPSDQRAEIQPQALSVQAPLKTEPAAPPAPNRQAAQPKLVATPTPLQAHSSTSARAELFAAAATAREASPKSAHALELRRAAKDGDLATLRTLLGPYIPLEDRDGSGRTALMLATLYGQAAAVRELLARGADPNATDAQGLTPLRVAESKDDREIAALLKQAGAR